MKRLTPREVMEKIKEDKELTNITKEEWFSERNRVDLQTKKAKVQKVNTKKKKINGLLLKKCKPNMIEHIGRSISII